MTSESTCSCSRIFVGMEATDARNWNPECARHGLDSDWHNAPEQVAERQHSLDMRRELRLKAKRKKNNGTKGEGQ